jgi:ATP-dependent RNA helicase RhlE
MPDREERPRGEGRGRNPRRDGVKPAHGGQPHRQRKPGPGGRDGGGQRDRTSHGDRPMASTQPFDPLAADRARSASHAARPQAEAKPDGEIARRPRGRRPSNGGRGYASKG